MNSGIQKLTFDTPFTTESGYTFNNPEVVFKTWGTLREDQSNVVLVCHALTGNAEADDWFSGLFEPGNLCDPRYAFTVCANILGSCYGTTGPTTVNPATERLYRNDFPVVTVRDMVRLNQRLLDTLDIHRIGVVIGASLGGMQALEWGIMDPRVERLILIAMGKAHTAWQIGISETQRQAIYADPNWNNGYYSPDAQPDQGLALARMIAMLSYRSAPSYEARFGREIRPDTDMFQVESYLRYQGQKLVSRFDAVSYIRLTQAMDSHDVARARGSYADVLQAVQKPALVVGITSDLLYPIHEQQELAGLLPRSVYHELDATQGHDAFLIEFNRMQAIFDTFLHETAFLPAHVS